MAFSPADLFAKLSELGIASTTRDHAPVFTVEESRHLRGEIAGAHTKNLFLRDNKKRYFLVTLDEDKVVDLKALRGLIGARGGLSFASPEALDRHLGIRPGSVSPFAVLNDAEGAVTVVFDADLMGVAMVNCHPLTNEKTTSIAPADLVTFLKAIDHAPVMVELTPSGAAADTSAAGSSQPV